MSQAQNSRGIWILVLSFAVPLIIGGSVGWLLVVVQDDHPGQGLNDQQYAEHEREVSTAASAQFIRFGIVSGIAGLGIAYILKRLSARPKS